MIYTRRRGGGEYELIGVSVGEGRTNMETRTVYRDLSTGEIHHRLASDFAIRMRTIDSQLPTDQIVDMAFSLRAEKLSWADICKKLDVKIGWLQYQMHKAGLKSAPWRTTLATPDKVAEARKLRAQGVCWKLVERKIGVNAGTLRRAMIIGRDMP